MKNMRLSVKLVGGFVIVALITLVIGYLGWSNITKLETSMKQIAENNLVAVKSLLTMSEGMTGLKASERTLIIPNIDQSIVQRQMDYFQTKTQNIDNGRQAYEALKRTPEEDVEWKNFITAYAAFRKDHDEFLRLYGEYAKSKDPAIYSNMYNQGLTVTYNSFNAAEAPLLKLVDMAEQNADKASQASENAAAQARLLTMIGMIVGALLALALGLYLSLSITRPVNKVAADLGEAAQQVAAASGQLSAASQQLAEGSNEQASSVEETSATLEEALSMVQQNGENTRQAASLSAQAKTSADKGNAEMEEMMRSMAELKKSSDQIAKIIKVIDDIAFQTNILALNAAVEAARAGDAGMGFAVVAEEVRNLAQRSAQAAKDTAAIIEGNIELSQKGVDVAQRVRDALGEITVQSKKVNELMDEIAAASQEQSQGIAQIHKAMDQISTATQQSAAAAEESSTTSEELSSQAATLQVIVGHLVTIVEGRSDRTLTSQATASPARAKTRNASPSGKAPNKQQPLKTAKKGRGVNPEDVIPLEDDTKDF